MRARPRLSHALALAIASVHAAVIVASPSLAYGQGQAQPVPYSPAPSPVPYGQPAPAASPPAVGSTPQVGTDVLYLKNGGMLRGTIIDAIPNAQARIQLATGEIATVQWSEIARIERGETSRPKPTTPGSATLPPLPATPPASPTAPSSSKPTPAVATVLVHVDGPEETQLEQDPNHEDRWHTVCTAPCDMRLPIGPDYRVNGPGMRTSGVFGLESQGNQREIITVNAASKGWFVLGVVSTALGGVVTVVGVLVALVGDLAASVDTNDGNLSAAHNDNNVAAAAWTMAGIGALALVGGIIMIVTNARTRTSQDFGSAMSPIRVADAWHRVPAWKDAAAPGNTLWSPPPVVGMPLLGGRF